MLKAALLLALVPLAALVTGLGLLAAGLRDVAGLVFALGTAVVLATLIVSIVTSLRRGEFGLDIIAALAMAGAIVAGEELAGVVVALMYAGGQALESYAQGRAEREMTGLLARVPRTALVHRNGALETVPIEDVQPGDRLLVRPGEIVPVDGEIASGQAILDESALTGEPMHVRRPAGAPVASGVANAGPAFDLVATRLAAESTFAGIVRLVEEARRSRAPMSRLADRYALGFLAVTLLLAGLAWVVSGDPRRALAVLVVATPCPLILAVPVAIVAGMSRSAKRGILVKSAGALERMARVRTLLIDKTGTLTLGRAAVVEILPAGGREPAEVLRVAASLAQGSQHAVSQAAVAAARERGLALATPSEVREEPGAGVEGVVDGRAVRIGHPAHVAALTGEGAGGFTPPRPGEIHLAVAVDGRPAGTIVLADPIRPETPDTLAALRKAGIARTVLVTGDQESVANHVAERLGLDAVHADVTPEGKVARVEGEERPTMMVGDGINDAAALARADVGVALGAQGAIAASQAADVVVLVDRLDRVAEAVTIARRTRAIALQSVYVGIGLSTFGMLLAAAGYLPPLAGALFQEVIDVAVVLNALRALRA